MRTAAKIVAAEALKQHRRMSGSKIVFFSMLLWPLLQLGITYYTIQPVALGTAPERWSVLELPGGLLAFLATGELAFTFFFSMVQAAFHFSFERQTGTLELLFLTPANRLILVMANGVGALIQNVWMFICFGAALVFASDAVRPAHPLMLLLVFGALCIPAIAWGAFLNGLLIFHRDSAFLFTTFDEPMRFVTGVQVPTFALPALIGGIGWVLPLTTSLVVVRRVLIDGAGLGALLPELAVLLMFTVLFLVLAALILAVGERKAQRTGQLRLF